MTTHVAIGASSWRDYNFLAPLSALVWRDWIGIRPVVLRSGDWDKNDRVVTALKALDAMKIDHAKVDDIPGYEESTVAQNCRQHASCLDLPPEDWLMPSDADLWPLKKEYFHQHEGWVARGVSLYANGDHYQTIPTCHLILRVKDWRKLGYGEANQSISGMIKTNLDPWLETYRQRWPWNDRNMAVWMSDQAMMTDKLRASGFYDDVAKVERYGHPPADRLDRNNWPAGPYKLEDFVDAHLFKAPDQPGNWERIFDVFKKILPQHADFAADYRERYVKTYSSL
jgi:hypothetical protein